MRRREFLGVVGGAAAAWPLAARAQQVGRVYRIGVFAGATNAVMVSAYRGFPDELRKLDFIEGQNLTVDLRPTAQTPPALSANAAEMVRAKVDVIVVAGTLQALQASAGTGIPIVVSALFDPIEHGYVKTLAEPGGTVTGVVLRNVELAEKQVELLTQAFPDRKRVAIFWDVISAEQFAAAERRAKAFGLDVMSIRFDSEPYDVQSAFRRMAESGPQMLLALARVHSSRHMPSPWAAWQSSTACRPCSFFAAMPNSAA